VQRLTLDTNILISAVAFGGNPARLLEKALVGEVEIFISDEIMAEFSRVIGRPKFGFDVDRIAEAQAHIKKVDHLPTDGLGTIDEPNGMGFAVISAITGLPPFPAAVANQVRRNPSPQPEDIVMNRRGSGIACFQTFHIIRHQKCKWHDIVLR